MAAGFAAMALGSDTGGSIRQPAAFCGVVGLKPTYGRVSRYGLVAFASSLDQIGPLDAILRRRGPRPFRHRRAGRARRHQQPSSHGRLSGGACPLATPGLRVGVPRDFLKEGVDGSVMAEFEKTIEALKRTERVIVDVALPHAPHAIATYYLVATAEASSNLARFDGVRYGLRAGFDGFPGHPQGHVRRNPG